MTWRSRHAWTAWAAHPVRPRPRLVSARFAFLLVMGRGAEGVGCSRHAWGGLGAGEEWGGCQPRCRNLVLARRAASPGGGCGLLKYSARLA